MKPNMVNPGGGGRRHGNRTRSPYSTRCGTADGGVCRQEGARRRFQRGFAAGRAKRACRRAAMRGLTNGEMSPPKAPISLTRREAMNW